MEDYKKIDKAGIGYFLANKEGKIINGDTKKLRKFSIKNGYYTFNSKGIFCTVHRLIAETFIPNPENKPYVSHINGNKLDNRVENLKWCTKIETSQNHDKEISHSRKVCQYDLNGNFIKTFDTITEASKEVGCDRKAITLVCKGPNKTAKGFKWKYEDEKYAIKNNIDISEAKKIEESTTYTYHNKELINESSVYVFKDGRIYSEYSKKFLKPVKESSGYCYITITNSLKIDPQILIKDHFEKNNISKEPVKIKYMGVGDYFVYPDGKVQDTKTKKICNVITSEDNNFVVLRKKKNYKIHRLVATYWVDNDDPKNKIEINHINYDKSDNRAENLEWVTRSENMMHANQKR